MTMYFRVRVSFLILMLIFVTVILSSQTVLAYDNSNRSIIPEEYRGLWAESEEVCNDPDGLIYTITATSFSAYELEARPLIVSGQITWWHLDRDMVKSVVILTAETGEGEVSIGKLKLSLSNTRLHINRIEENSEERKLDNPLIKCSNQ
jgi:hypothetical protein